MWTAGSLSFERVFATYLGTFNNGSGHYSMNHTITWPMCNFPTTTHAISLKMSAANTIATSTLEQFVRDVYAPAFRSS